MNVFAICVVVFFIIFETKGADLISPCPNILKYEEQKETDRWHGLLELQSLEAIEGIRIHISLDSKADVLINSFGETNTLDNQKFVINKPGFTLPSDKLLRLKFAVKYNPEKPIPKVASIKLNGIEVCSDNVIPHHATPTADTNPGPLSTEPSVTSKLPPVVNVRVKQDVVCGIRAVARPLVYNGKVAEREWPWHVAMMLLSKRDSKFNYHCGATLISDTYILTAAHCVTILSTRKLIDTDMYVVHLGLNHLEDAGPSSKLRLISGVLIHTNYDPAKYDNDVAVLKLNDPVEFNDFIRPICLWEGDLDIRHLIGQAGTVVGWGLNNKNVTSVELMEAKLPVVGLETCLYHDRSFFSQFTSPNTYCAGGGGTGPAVCSGDSGGGMVFPKPGTSGKDTIWVIRGIVSVSPRDSDSVCNTKSYAVFTDVAQHLTWIKTAAHLK